MFTPLSWSGRPAKWLKITAAFEMALAAVFLSVGYRSPLLRGTFYLVGAILGGVGLLLWMWGRRMGRGYQEAMRLKATGVPGQARILGMRQTGMYLNQQPQVELTLEVTSEMHGAYQVTKKEWVPLIALGRLSAGVPLPVRVDPADQSNLVIEWEHGGTGIPAAGPPFGGGSNTTDAAAEKRRILREGTPGRARILSSSATGERDAEERPVYSLTLHVDVPGFSSIQGAARVGIPEERLGQLEPGDSVPVKVDPANPASMAVDWDSA